MNLKQIAFTDIKNLGILNLEKILEDKPAIHRYPGVMAKYLIQSSEIIILEFGNSPNKIWSDLKNDEIIANFKKLKGVGYHKAVQGLLILSELYNDINIGKNELEYLHLKCEQAIYNVGKDVRLISGEGECDKNER